MVGSVTLYGIVPAVPTAADFQELQCSPLYWLYAAQVGRGNPRELETEINQLTGVVSNGLFACRPADLLLLGTPEGVRELLPAR